MGCQPRCDVTYISTVVVIGPRDRVIDYQHNYTSVIILSLSYLVGEVLCL